MTKATVIIGANFGDEGKGLMTDYFATKHTTVVRFNGGAQAGHTVVRNGKRHVFHHFGSGTMQGASTFLSRFFICNPIMFLQEDEVLNELGYQPEVMVDPKCMVTTPWDMMINQIAEESRGNDRHGSVGVGINETIQRHGHEAYELTVSDLTFEKNLYDTLYHRIRKSWVPERLHALGLEPSDDWMRRLYDIDVVYKFMEYCKAFLMEIDIKSTINDVIAEEQQIIFEGAQGLLLAEDHRFFPHVTHSHTGLKNVLELVKDTDIDELTAIYATRAYATRHGAGPFPREVEGLSYEDGTNVHNMWQGSIRFGHLDLDLLRDSVLTDIGRHKNLIKIRHGLAITCLDQVGTENTFWNRTKECTESVKEFVHQAIDGTMSSICFASYGPTAEDVRLFWAAF